MDRTPRTEDGAWSLGLMGGFRLQRRNEPVPVPPAAQRLIAFLAMQPGPTPRAYVSGALWPDLSQERAFANLRSALWRIRREAADLVDAGDHAVGLSIDLRSDVAVVIGSGERVLRAGVSGACRLEEDPARFFHELLPGWYDDWASAERERMRQLCLHALEAIAASCTHQGHHSSAIQAALAAVRLDPLRESARLILIRAHVAEGNRSEALRQYRAYERMLLTELGVRPSPGILDAAGEPASPQFITS